MENSHSPLETLLDIEARHEDLLKRLDDLDSQVASTLAQWRGDKKTLAEVLPGISQ